MQRKGWFLAKGFLLASVAFLVTCRADQSYVYQPDVYQWEKTFGGILWDYAYSVQQTTDGGYIIAGETQSFGAGSSDVYLIKTDADGYELWSKTFGGKNQDSGRSVRETTDGGYIITGETYSFGAGSSDVYLIKTDADGYELWSKTFGGENQDSGRSVQETTDGGYIIAGETLPFLPGSLNVYLIKTDADGYELWSKTFGGTDHDCAFSVQETSDGGYIIAGATDSFGAGQTDVYLIKTDANGDELWSNTFGGSGLDWGESVQQTTDGGYIIAGLTYPSYGVSYDVYLIKTDADGYELWSKTFGGTDRDFGHSVQQTADGGYIIAGGTGLEGTGPGDVYLIKTDVDGEELWSKTFGGTDGDWGSSVWQTRDGGFIIAGGAESFGAGDNDVYLIYYKPPS